MSKVRVFKFVAPAVAALVAAAACGEEEGGNGNSNAPVGPGTTATPTTPGSTPATPGSTPSPSATEPATPASMCMNTADGGGAPPMVDGATWIFSYGDSANMACMAPSTHCLDVTQPGKMCLEGVAADAMTGYPCWGAGFGVQMAVADDMGVVTLPWDAAAAGVAGVKLTLTGSGPALRAQIGVDGLPDDATYVHGGGTADIAIDGMEHVLMFDEFTFPSWTVAADAHPELDGVAMDTTKLKGIQFQVPTAIGATAEYSFCVESLAWVDAMGTVVDVVEPVVEPDAGAGGAGAGGAGAGGAGAGGAGAGGAGAGGAGAGGAGAGGAGAGGAGAGGAGAGGAGAGGAGAGGGAAEGGAGGDGEIDMMGMGGMGM